jgi:hypothetical protein
MVIGLYQLIDQVYESHRNTYLLTSIRKTGTDCFSRYVCAWVGHKYVYFELYYEVLARFTCFLFLEYCIAKHILDIPNTL